MWLQGSAQHGTTTQHSTALHNHIAQSHHAAQNSTTTQQRRRGMAVGGVDSDKRCEGHTGRGEAGEGHRVGGKGFVEAVYRG